MIEVGTNPMPISQLVSALIFLFCAVILSPETVSAHVNQEELRGFETGLVHPILGADHLLAMLAVGIWGAQVGGRSIWTLPVIFPLIMAVGGFLGVIGIPLPEVEPAIALSSLILGLAILVAWQAPEWIAVALVGTFAVFHGYAHGLALPQTTNPMTYVLGFVVATGLIHLIGIGFGLLFARPLDGWVARVTGGAIALAGIYFLVG